MRYRDLKENYSPEEDTLNALELSDTRKSRLTLMHLSKLRKIREYRKYQQKVDSEKASRMYGAKPEGGDDIGSM